VEHNRTYQKLGLCLFERMLPPLVYGTPVSDMELNLKITQMESVAKIKDALLKEYEKLINSQNKKIKELCEELDKLKQ
jgi:hypothetical protein